MAPPASYNASALIKAAKASGITDKKELAMFAAQMAHESGGFQYDEEIASGSAYNGREDLGNNKDGDGERYKGRGYTQLTGKANYKHFGEKIGIDLLANPNLAKDPDIAARIAVEYWKERVDREAAKSGDVERVTKQINGGYNGLEDRKQYYNKFMDKLPVAAAASSGMTLPTESSLSAVIEDLNKNGNPAVAKQLDGMAANYKKRDGNLSDADKEKIALALNELQKNISELFKQNKTELDDKNQMMAVHLGPFSTLVALKNDGNVKDAKLKINGVDCVISEKSFKAFTDEMKAPLDYQTATIAQLKEAADKFYEKQKDEAQKIIKKQQEGSVKKGSTEEKDIDFFNQITAEMAQKNPIVGIFLMMVSFMATTSDEKEKNKAVETEVAPATVTASTSSPAPEKAINNIKDLPKLLTVSGGTGVTGNPTTPNQDLPSVAPTPTTVRQK